MSYVIYNNEDEAQTDHNYICQQEGLPRAETHTLKAYTWGATLISPKVYAHDNYFLQTYFPEKARYTWDELITLGLVA